MILVFFVSVLISTVQASSTEDHINYGLKRSIGYAFFGLDSYDIS